MEQGSHRFDFDASGLASGVYVAVLSTDSERISTTLVIQ